MPFKIASPSILPAGLAPYAAAGQARQYTDQLNLKLADLRQQDVSERRRAALAQADMMLRQQQMQMAEMQAIRQLQWEQERFGQEQQYRRDALSLNQQELEYKLGALDQQRDYQNQMLDFKLQTEDAKRQYYADRIAQQQQMLALQEQRAADQAAWRNQQQTWQTENQQLKSDLSVQNQARLNRVEDRRAMESDRAAMQFQLASIGKQIDDQRALIGALPGGMANQEQAAPYIQNIQALMQEQARLGELYNRRYGIQPTFTERLTGMLGQIGSSLFTPAPAPAPAGLPVTTGNAKYKVTPVP